MKSRLDLALSMLRRARLIPKDGHMPVTAQDPEVWYGEYGRGILQYILIPYLDDAAGGGGAPGGEGGCRGRWKAAGTVPAKAVELRYGAGVADGDCCPDRQWKRPGERYCNRASLGVNESHEIDADLLCCCLYPQRRSPPKHSCSTGLPHRTAYLATRNGGNPNASDIEVCTARRSSTRC